MPFDDPLIAYAIAQCHLPVIAAIGHHDDYCIAEEICYHREKTPTAAADFILSRFEAVQTRLEQNLTKISQRFLELLNNFKDRQFYLSEKLRSSAKDSNIKQAHIVQKMSYKINENAYACLYKTAQRLQELKSQLPLQSSLQSQKLAFHLDKQQEKLNTLSQSFLERKNGQIDLNMQKLQHSDPVPWMQKGWTQLIKQGKKLQSIKQVTVGDPLMAPMLDGLLQLKVETITKKEKQND